MRKAIYAIDAFPDDAQLWRIDWIGGAAYNASVPSEPTLWFAFDPNQYYVGSYVLGTFTATSTTQTFNVGISYTNSTHALLSTVTSQLNAVLVGTPGDGH